MNEQKEPMWVHCGDCQHEWVMCYMPMRADLFARFKRVACPMCASRKVLVGGIPKPTGEGDPISWLANGDTGISSRTIWFVLMGRPIPANDWTDVPHDPADFGRCHRLLAVMPSWRARLGEVAAEYPEWKPLVDHWDELAALYEEELPKGTAPKMYARMQELRALVEA